jgi:hypothetical protein
MDTVVMATDPGPGGGSGAAAAPGRSGATVGVSIAIVAAAAALALGSPFIAAGIPAAALAGWIVGPQIRPGDGFVGASIAMTALTTALADAVIVGVLVAAMFMSGSPTHTSIPAALGGSLVLWGLGLVFVGIPMLLVTVPCGLIWAGVVRRLARRADDAEPGR